MGKVTVAIFTALIAAAAAAERLDSDALTIDAFARLPQMAGVQVSPDGSHIAYIRPKDGRPHLAVERLPPKPSAVLVAPLEELTFEWVKWANDDRLVFLASFFDRHRTVEIHETRLFAVDKRGENLTPLVQPGKFKHTGSRLAKDRDPPHWQGGIVHWLPDRPNHILVAIDDDHDVEYGIRKIDVRTGDYEEVVADRQGVQEWLVDGSGEARLGFGHQVRSRSTRDGDFTATYLDDQDVWRTTTNPKWHLSGYHPVAATADRAIYLMKGPAEDGFTAIRKVNVVTDKVGEVVLADGRSDVDQVYLDRAGNQVIGARFTGPGLRSEYIDDSMSRLQRSVDRVLPERSNQIASWSTNKRRVIVHSASATVPGEYYFWNRDAKTFDLLGETMPGLSSQLLAPVSSHRYQARDGLSIEAYLTVPRGEDPKNLPVVVLPHDGPASHDSNRFDFIAQFLASRGYAVFQPNFRGSSGYGRAFKRAGHGQWGGKMQDDVTDGTRWLVAQGIADPKRICTAGIGYGGYAAVMGLIRAPDLYRCAASVNGIMNLPRQIEDYKLYVGTSEMVDSMGLEGSPASEVSPHHLADRIQGPVLLIHVRENFIVPLKQGKDMVQRLESLDKPVSYVELESGGHALGNRAARAQVLAALESFLADAIGPGTQRAGGR